MRFYTSKKNRTKVRPLPIRQEEQRDFAQIQIYAVIAPANKPLQWRTHVVQTAFCAFNGYDLRSL